MRYSVKAIFVQYFEVDGVFVTSNKPCDWANDDILVTSEKQCDWENDVTFVKSKNHVTGQMTR